MGEALALARFVAGAVVAVLPAFLLSVGLGVLIRSLALDGLIRRAFESRVGLGILLATAVGAFSPLCSCTVIPVVSGLLMSGVPLAPVMAFWVASPTMDPEIFALSVAMLGWPLALARLGATLAVSLGAGWLTFVLTRSGLFAGGVLRAGPSALAPVLVPVGSLRRPAGRTISGGAGPDASGDAGAPARTPVPAGGGWRGLLAASVARLEWPAFWRGFGVESVRLGRWLLLAFVLEALIVRYVPQAAIAQVLGRESWFAVPLAALVGIPLYLNSASALPIVSGLLARGMQPGAAIAFLIAGPVTTVPAMAAVWGVARPRVFALYLGTALGGAVLLGALTNLLLA